MMTLANYGIGSSKRKDPNSAKVLSKSLQIRNRAELLLKQYLKSHYRINDERRSEISNLISDYYSRIPFNIIIWNKYQTKQCIIDSILLLDSKFNPYKAREAFKCVENMLIHLVYLPWHKEFRRIHTYSGQFRLAVSGPLIGVEEILKAAGFQQSYDCPMHLILPDNRMPQTDDGESVTSVIFDCMLAQIVCSDIIEIFEHCCRALKQSDDSIVDINCYNWIQAYFRERSQQTTERACANIQELLNNISNHLSKHDSSAMKSIQSERIASKADKLTENNGVRIAKTLLNTQRSNEASRESPKLTAQARTREFLAQQSQEDENLLRLTSDLLRLPTSSSSDSNSSGGRKLVQSLGGHKMSDQESISNRSGGLRQNQGGGASDAIMHQQSLLNNGYDPHQYHRQALYDRGPASSKTNHEPYESYGIHHSSNDSLSNHHHHPAIDHIDSPHNDRELLLPRYDRRLASHQQSQLQSKRNSFYDKNLDINHQLSIKSNGVAGHLLGSNRYAGNEPESYFTEPPSHVAQLSSNHQLKGLSSSSKYVNNNDSTYRKYESRDADDNNKLLANSRSYWSCSSCTYNNQVNSEICEICRSRRPSR